jgi:hypothetical protein
VRQAVPNLFKNIGKYFSARQREEYEKAVTRVVTAIHSEKSLPIEFAGRTRLAVILYDLETSPDVEDGL